MTSINLKDWTAVRTIAIPGDTGGGVIELYERGNEYLVYRLAARGKIKNYISNYEYIDKDNNSTLKPIDLNYGNKILQRIKNGDNYSDAFIFYEEENADEVMAVMERAQQKSEQEHQYTSTGIKFWRHVEQMFAYKRGFGHSIISTHISPEGACNLKCPYCSVTYRDTHSRIPLETIKNYVLNLKKRGLKAVILTGGGEPTLYKDFNELVRWLHDEQELSVALITNGTMTSKVADDVWKMFSWIRVSINVFDGWLNPGKISLPLDKIDQDKTVLGCSMVYTVEHESSQDFMADRVELLKKVSNVADACGAQYIRLLPNCLLSQYDLVKQHASLDNVLKRVDDPRYFHQYKVHGAPKSATCHQSYFRPYLSEEIHVKTGKPGTVYPCDSVVLNDGYQHFAEEYQLCHADDVLDWLDRKIEQRFDARKRCTGCVFTQNVDMLDDWKEGNINKFSDFPSPLKHEEFV